MSGCGCYAVKYIRHVIVIVYEHTHTYVYVCVHKFYIRILYSAVSRMVKYHASSPHAVRLTANQVTFTAFDDH